MSNIKENFVDKVMDGAVERDAKRVGYDPKKAGKRFYDGPVSAVKGTAASALTGFAVNPITMTNLYKAKARTDRVNRQRVYAGIKSKFKGNSHE